MKVLAGGKTRCAGGGPYAFWLRKGDPGRLLVFFQGGGGCFDQRTCAPGSTWFDDRVDAGDDPALNGGILDLADARNPFRECSPIRGRFSSPDAARAASAPPSTRTRSSGGTRRRA